MAEEADISWENKVTLKSFWNTWKSEARGYLPRFETPLLYVCGNGNLVLPLATHKAPFSLIKGPKEIILLDLDEFNPKLYVEGKLKQTMDPEVAFVKKVLM
jgi:hypothetical protein